MKNGPPWGNLRRLRVEARDEAHAVEIFSNAGIDGWTGYNFKEYKITAVSKR